jgi:hypothetical protein
MIARSGTSAQWLRGNHKPRNIFHPSDCPTRSAQTSRHWFGAGGDELVSIPVIINQVNGAEADGTVQVTGG